MVFIVAATIASAFILVTFLVVLLVTSMLLIYWRKRYVDVVELKLVLYILVL